MNAKGKGVKETKGKYATAWLNHGKAPNNGSYQYIIYPNIGFDGGKNLGKIVREDNSYSILRADSIAHIVVDKKTFTTGYVVFEPNKNLEVGILKEVSDPALVIYACQIASRTDMVPIETLSPRRCASATTDFPSGIFQPSKGQKWRRSPSSRRKVRSHGMPAWVDLATDPWKSK